MADPGEEEQVTAARTANERDVLLQTEYSALRDEIATGLVTIRQLEAGALAGTGALLAWLATHGDTPRQAWCLPIALVVAAALRALGTYNSVNLVGEYLREKEASSAPSELRWETWRKPRSSHLRVIGYFFWGALAATAVVAAFYGHEWTHAGLPAERGIELRCSPSPDADRGVLLRCEPASR